MNEPTFDADGYPTDDTLEAIINWPLVNYPADYEAAMDFVGRAWSYQDYWRKESGYSDEDTFGPVIRYVFSTGGWSGNESLIGAVEENIMLRVMGAWSWRRGGHYEYRFNEPKE